MSNTLRPTLEKMQASAQRLREYLPFRAAVGALLPTEIHVSVAAAYNSAPPVVLTARGPRSLATREGATLYRAEREARAAEVASC